MIASAMKKAHNEVISTNDRMCRTATFVIPVSMSVRARKTAAVTVTIRRIRACWRSRTVSPGLPSCVGDDVRADPGPVGGGDEGSGGDGGIVSDDRAVAGGEVGQQDARHSLQRSDHLPHGVDRDAGIELQRRARQQIGTDSPRPADGHDSGTLRPFAAGGAAFLPRMSKNGLMMSIGIGKTTVELCSPPISVSVCR